ncbi:metallo-beta-lactamase class B [Oxalobacteraceae bacterium GrIS 1.18]
MTPLIKSSWNCLLMMFLLLTGKRSNAHHQKDLNALKLMVILFCIFSITCFASDSPSRNRTANSNAEPLIQDSFNSPENWRRPVTPFQIADHTWYIGSEGLSAVLIKTKKGAILIDGGLPGATKMLLTHMAQLGVSSHDLKWILLSHAHFDHAGPLAEIHRVTGAQLATNAETATLLERGGKGDIHFGDLYPFPPAKTDRFLMDGETIELGGVVLTAHFTPAHTPGTISWTWTDQRENQPIRIAYLDSLTAPGYKLKDNPRYPHIVEDFRHGFDVMQSISCDLVLTPHPEGSGWTPGKLGSFLNSPMTCAAYTDHIRERLNKQLQEQKAPGSD